MKASKYNYFIKDGEKIICFNSVSGRIFSAGQEQFAFINNIVKTPDNNTGEEELKAWLKDNNFILDKDTDESKDIIARNREAVFGGMYHLIINPTLECNFRCWYCYENHHKGHMSEATVNNLKKYIDRLIESGQCNEGMHLSWFGGEPLLYFEKIVYPLSLYVKNKMKEAGLPYRNGATTNGYLINKKIISLFDEIDFRSFQITLDGDRETHNNTRKSAKTSSFDTIIGNVIDICRDLREASVILRINYTDEIIKKDFGKILDIIPQNIRQHIQVSFHRVWQTMDKATDNNTYLIDNIHKLRDMGLKVITNNIYSPKRTHACYADRYNFAHINYDGNVYKCTAQDYSEEYAVGKLSDKGEIDWKPGILDRMHERANFENKMCLECKKLPLCGGPCVKKVMQYKEGKLKNICHGSCAEMDESAYIKEYYKDFRKKFDAPRLVK